MSFRFFFQFSSFFFHFVQLTLSFQSNSNRKKGKKTHFFSLEKKPLARLAPGHLLAPRHLRRSHRAPARLGRQLRALGGPRRRPAALLRLEQLSPRAAARGCAWSRSRAPAPPGVPEVPPVLTPRCTLFARKFVREVSERLLGLVEGDDGLRLLDTAQPTCKR